MGRKSEAITAPVPGQVFSALMPNPTRQREARPMDTGTVEEDPNFVDPFPTATAVVPVDKTQDQVDAIQAANAFLKLKEVAGLILGNLANERYREYDFEGRACYRVSNPVGVYYRPGGTTHRVVDLKGVTHCVPAPGHNGCVLRWLGREDAACSW